MAIGVGDGETGGGALAPKKRLNGQSEVFYFTDANENSEIVANCALTKAVNMPKNKDMLICVPFVRLKTF